MTTMIQTQFIAFAGGAEILQKPFRKIAGYIRACKVRSNDLRMLQELTCLDDAKLRDIGVSRTDLAWACRLPVDAYIADDQNNVDRLNATRAKNLPINVFAQR